MFNKKLFTLTLYVGVFILSAAPLRAATPFPEGTLLKGELAEVFLVDADAKLRWIPNEATFKALGYDWSAVMAVDNAVLYQYTFGESLTVVEEKATLPTSVEIEAKVRELFADAPVMISVAKCESGFAQFRSDGSLVRSPNGLYVGVFQIAEHIHSEYALSLGMNIKTVEGNLAYARRLYDQQGAQPWASCASRAGLIKNDLKPGDSHPEVKTLQQILNKAGYVISATGLGSAGNETEYYGSLTKDAVQRFQCDKNIVCKGDPDTTGYGAVGPKTRFALSRY